jgi:hypothetical protein
VGHGGGGGDGESEVKWDTLACFVCGSSGWVCRGGESWVRLKGHLDGPVLVVDSMFGGHDQRYFFKVRRKT